MAIGDNKVSGSTVGESIVAGARVSDNQSGGAPAFDIDSIYGASDVGDFYQTVTGQFTDAGVTAATTAGDTIQQWQGQRTTGTSITANQATASSKPELAADATYGLSTLFPGGALKWISDESFGGAIRLQGARFRLDNVTGGAGNSSGHVFGASDFSGFNDAPIGIGQNLDLISRGGITVVTGVSISDTDWHTVVVQWEADGADNWVRVYLDDMTTPVHTANIGGFGGTHTNYRLGHNSPMLSGVHHYRSMSHSSWDAATPAEIASWLEAS